MTPGRVMIGHAETGGNENNARDSGVSHRAGGKGMGQGSGTIRMAKKNLSKRILTASCPFNYQGGKWELCLPLI